MSAPVPRVRTFSFEGLPWLPSEGVARTRTLAASLARFASPVPVSVRGLGTVRLRLDGYGLGDREAAVADGAAASFALETRLGPGALVVDGALALRLIQGVLGAGEPRGLRPLAAVERGVLAAAVLPLLEAVVQPGAACLDLRPAAPSPGRLSIRFAVASRLGAGLLTLSLPPAAGGLLRAEPPSARALARLQPQVDVALAATLLPRAEAQGLAPGDAVLFTGRGALETGPAAPPWPVRVTLGRFGAEAEAHPDGRVLLTTPLRELEEEPYMDTEEFVGGAEPAAGDGARDENRSALASAPVEVVAELGRVALRGDEALGLAPGAVLSLGVRRPDTVLLRVAGRPWARGELVNVDDELGVRVLELLR
jgi:flagellar motor switch/type III secretory pathway protein FliN